MICDHQFYSTDETNWIFTTSASSLLGGSTTAKKILQELFKKRHEEMIKKSEKIKRKKREVTTEDSPRVISNSNPFGKRVTEQKPWPENPREVGQEFLIIRNPSLSNFENFDASQHLNGCPVKWLYNKKLSDRNKKYKITRWCSKKTGEEKETKKEKTQNVRDKIPIEVKIHKINLVDKCDCKSDENFFPPFKSSSSPPLDKSAAILEPLETHRKKLAAKLNWKLHDETGDDCQLDASSDISSRQNYLPPRPLLGLKPLLSILLSPHQETSCCNAAAHLLQNSTRCEKSSSTPSFPDSKTPEHPSLSIQSLDLPPFISESKSRPKTTMNTPRWGSKSSRLQKKLQIPNQITINLRQTTKTIPPKPDTSNLQGRKLTDKSKSRPKSQRSLSSLIYELSDKTNSTVQPFEDLLKDLMMEDDHFKIKRFLHYNCETNLLAPFNDSQKRNQDNKIKMAETDSTTTSTDDTAINLICHGVRLSRKSHQSKRMTQREKY